VRTYVIGLTPLVQQQLQARRTAAKENRAARVPRNVLIDKLLELFKEHRIWGLRDLKIKVEQPEAYVRDVLLEVAFMWKNGDWNGKWELKNAYKERDVGLMNTTTVAPEAVESEAGTPSGMDEDDENETFEDVA
jgi:transcription initiation factor TFIIF subunit beta